MDENNNSESENKDLPVDDTSTDKTPPEETNTPSSSSMYPSLKDTVLTDAEPSVGSSPKLKTGNFEKKSLKDKIRGNKRLLGIGAGVFLLLVLGGGYLLTRPGGDTEPVISNNSEESVNVSAKISYVEGTVERKDGDTFAALKAEDELNDGDNIRTAGADSRAVIALSNGSFVRLNGDTEITLLSLDDENVVISQLNGQVYSRISPDSGAYTVESIAGTYRADGTAFRTITGGDGESVEVYESKVKENGTDKTVDEGKKLYLKNTQDASKEGQLEDLDIDEVKSDDFVSWCRSEDEKIDEFKDKLGFLSDITTPELNITSPADKSTVTVASGATSGSVVFKGKTEAGATLTIQSLSVTGSSPASVKVGSDGNFESDAITGIIGASKFEVVAKDPAGNKAKKTITVTFKKPSTTTASGITLAYGGFIDGKYQVSWSTSSSFIDADGFKVVWNTSGSPTYPTSGTKAGSHLASSDENNASLSLEASPDKDLKYYVRVCRYINGDCDNYSNQVTITVPKKTT